MRRWGASAALVAVALAVAACSDDDAADPTTVVTTGSTATSGSTATTRSTTTTTEATTTSSSTTTTTAPPPTTQSVDQLKAEVEAAYRDLDAKGYAVLRNPTLEGLDALVADIALPGSPYAQALTTRVTQLVQNGQYLVPDDPSLNSVTIEMIEATAPGQATVTACLVSNDLTVKRADQSPIPGRSIPIANPEVYATRVSETLVLTDSGWRHDSIGSPDEPIWQGSDRCPAA